MKKMVSSLVTESLECRFPVWKTITLGTCKSVGAYRKAFQDAIIKDGAVIKIDEWAGKILKGMKVTTRKTTLDIALVSVYGLGFTTCPTLERIYERALRDGLELCPDDLALALRLAYFDQPYDQKGVHTFIAMEPKKLDWGPRIFTLMRNIHGWWLDSKSTSTSEAYLLSDKFVFVRPRKKK